jgi:uncharacterized protein (DUF2236 family)
LGNATNTGRRDRCEYIIEQVPQLMQAIDHGYITVWNAVAQTVPMCITVGIAGSVHRAGLATRAFLKLTVQLLLPKATRTARLALYQRQQQGCMVWLQASVRLRSKF